MRILIIAATKQEIESLVIDSKEVEVLITGIGVPATMYALQKKLQQNSIDLVIQAGIAGSFETNRRLSEVVLVKQDTFADIGMEENNQFTHIFQSGFADKDEFPFDDGWLINNNVLFAHTLLPAVKAITVNKVSDSPLQFQQIMTGFAPQIETMEGAALHYVCLEQNVSFMQIRSISNYVGERNKSNWVLNEAIVNLKNELQTFIAMMKRQSAIGNLHRQ